MATYLNYGYPGATLATGFGVHQGTSAYSVSVTDFDYTNNNIMIFRTNTGYNISFSGATGTLVYGGNYAYVSAWSVTSSSFTINASSGSVGYCAIPKTSVISSFGSSSGTKTQNITASDWNDYNMLFIFGNMGGQENLNRISLMTNASYAAYGYMGLYYITENATSIKYYNSWSSPEILIKVPKSAWPSDEPPELQVGDVLNFDISPIPLDLTGYKFTCRLKGNTTTYPGSYSSTNYVYGANCYAIFNFRSVSDGNITLGNNYGAYIALTNGTGTDIKYNRVMVAGDAGGSTSGSTGTNVGGGAAGVFGGTGATGKYGGSSTASSTQAGKGGTQSAGGAKGTYSGNFTSAQTDGGFGTSGSGSYSYSSYSGYSFYGGAGGRGWYGGGGGINVDSGNKTGGGGGSSYLLTDTSYKPEGYFPEWTTYQPLISNGTSALLTTIRDYYATITILSTPTTQEPNYISVENDICRFGLCTYKDSNNNEHLVYAKTETVSGYYRFVRIYHSVNGSTPTLVHSFPESGTSGAEGLECTGMQYDALGGRLFVMIDSNNSSNYSRLYYSTDNGETFTASLTFPSKSVTGSLNYIGYGIGLYNSFGSYVVATIPSWVNSSFNYSFAFGTSTLTDTASTLGTTGRWTKIISAKKKENGSYDFVYLAPSGSTNGIMIGNSASATSNALTSYRVSTMCYSDADDYLYFTSSTASSLYRCTAGAPEGTTAIGTPTLLMTDTIFSSVSNMEEIDGKIYIFKSENGGSIYEYDPTSGTLSLVITVYGSGYEYSRKACMYNGEIYFTHSHGASDSNGAGGYVLGKLSTAAPGPVLPDPSILQRYDATNDEFDPCNIYILKKDITEFETTDLTTPVISQKPSDSSYSPEASTLTPSVGTEELKFASGTFTNTLSVVGSDYSSKTITTDTIYATVTIPLGTSKCYAQMSSSVPSPYCGYTLKVYNGSTFDTIVDNDRHTTPIDITSSISVGTTNLFEFSVSTSGSYQFDSASDYMKLVLLPETGETNTFQVCALYRYDSTNDEFVKIGG